MVKFYMATNINKGHKRSHFSKFAKCTFYALVLFSFFMINLSNMRKNCMSKQLKIYYYFFAGL